VIVPDRLRSVFRADEKSMFADPDHVVRRVAIVVNTEYRTTPWRYDQDKSHFPDVGDSLKYRGSGSLEDRGWKDVKDAIDPDDVEEPTHVATLVVDLDEWQYLVEWTAAGRELADG